MKKDKKGASTDTEPQDNAVSVDVEAPAAEEPVQSSELLERDIESLQYFFGKRKLEPFDNSEILRCRLLYQLKSSKYKDCYTIVNKNTGKSLGIVPKMQIRHSWRMAHSKDAQKVVKNKLFFMTYEEWQDDAAKLEKYIKSKREYYDKDNEVLFSEVWSLSESEFESVGLKRPQQFMALLQTAILGEIEETRRTLSAWKRLKKYIHRVPLESSLGGIFSQEDAIKLKSRLHIKWLNDIRKQNVFKLKNALLEFDFEQIVKDINKAYKADLARRKDFRYKVHPFVAAFSNLAIVTYVAYLYKYTLIKNTDMTQLIMLLLSLCVLDTLVVFIGGLRGRRRRLVRPGYVYYSPKVKKTLKWYTAFSVFVLLSVFVFYQRYDGYNDKVYYRDLEDGTITVAGAVDKETYSLAIPNSVDNKPVTEIAPYSFYNSNLNEITIPDSVKRIKNGAFANNTSLHKVSIPEGSVEICASAFKKSAVVNLTLPSEGETVIGKNAFRNCLDLKNIENMQSVTSIAENAFRDCSSLANFELSEKLTTVGKKAFMNCSYISSLGIPSSVTSIGKKAFYYCDNLEYLAIPYAGTSAEDSLDQTIEKIVKFNYPSGQRVTVAINSSAPIGNESFREVVWISALELGEAVTEIPSHAFIGTPNLKTVKMTTNVVEIGESAFANATSLSQVSGADGVLSIGNGAFSACVNLESVEFAAIQNIGESAFIGCSTLSDVGELSELRTVGSYAFNGCSSLDIDIHTGESFTEVAPYAFSNSSIKSFTADDGLLKIGVDAFANCSSLGSIDLPSTVVEVGERAFYACSGLKSADLSKTSVSTMGNYAFAYCTQLANVSLSTKTDRIPEGTFMGCQNFGGLSSIKNISALSIRDIGISAFESTGTAYSLVIPDSVKTIGNRAFANTRITDITVSNTLDSMGNGAFDSCYNLEKAVLPYIGVNAADSSNGYAWVFGNTDISDLSLTNVNSISGNALSAGAGSITSVTISGGMTAVPASLFDNFNQLETVVIPSTVTSIGNRAFANCHKLRAITIPSGVTSIGMSAFENCRQLTSVNIPVGVTVIQTATFKNCTALRSVNFNSLKLTSIGEEAFMNNSNIEFDGTFNAGLVTVGARAFAGCNIEQVVLDKSTTKLDRDAFGGNVVINIFVTEELLKHYTELFKNYNNVKIMSI